MLSKDITVNSQGDYIFSMVVENTSSSEVTVDMFAVIVNSVYIVMDSPVEANLTFSAGESKTISVTVEKRNIDDELRVGFEYDIL